LMPYVAAKVNNAGVVGVAAGARLAAVKVVKDDGSGWMSDAACGIDWVTRNAATYGIKAANMSLSWRATSPDAWTGPAGTCANTGGDVMHAAICQAMQAGVTFAVSAGNNSANVSANAPAAYPEVLTVSALADFDGAPGSLFTSKGNMCAPDEDDTFANFSNYGAGVDIIAPGVCIWSTLHGGGYGYKSGTSMAAPHVTGAIVRYAATHAGATPAQTMQAIKSTGNTAWRNTDDRDTIKEPLLDVQALVAQ
jgi:subtilisin